MPLVRLRKMVAFERFLARLITGRPDAWLLKGGLALQWRLGDRARTTQDLDMLLIGPQESLHATLMHAALLEMGDWFHYMVRQPSHPQAHGAGGLRFSVQALLDGRPFETFHLDVGWGDPVVETPEELAAPSLLTFAGIAPVAIPCYPITQHIAEKVHACSRPHTGGESSRVKDLVDIVLIAGMWPMSAEKLLEAIEATFRIRATHALPRDFSDPPANWAATYRRLATEVGLEADRLEKGIELARSFLNPLLQGRARGLWDPEGWQWTESPHPDRSVV
jgi:hypothetical protein